MVCLLADILPLVKEDSMRLPAIIKTQNVTINQIIVSFALRFTLLIIKPTP
jgi:hypothetical protein